MTQTQAQTQPSQTSQISSQKLREPFVEILSKLQDLRAQIDSKGDISTLLIRIHKDVYEKPECFGVLKDSEIATLIEGIEIHTRKELVVGKEKPRIKKKFSMSDLDLSL